MVKRLTCTAALAGVLCLAAIAWGQNADQNTAGPTRNQLQLKLTEPREGQQISGSTIRVAVDYNRTIFGAGQGTHFGEANFPHPIFDVYLDNNLKDTLKGGQSNVAEISGVPPGNHKIVVMAKNISGEVIDRATVNVVNVEAASTGTTSTMGATTSSAPAESSAPAPSYSAPPPAPAPAPEAPRTTAPEPTAPLPQTASNAPAAAALGLALLAGGLWIGRKRF